MEKLDRIANINFKKQWITEDLNVRKKPNFLGRWFIRKFKGQEKLTHYATLIANAVEANRKALLLQETLLSNLRNKLQGFQAGHAHHKYRNVFAVALGKIKTIETQRDETMLLKTQLNTIFGADLVAQVWDPNKTKNQLIAALFKKVDFNTLSITKVKQLKNFCTNQGITEPQGLVQRRLLLLKAAFGKRALSSVAKKTPSEQVRQLSQRLMRSKRPISEAQVLALHRLFFEEGELALSAPAGFVDMISDIAHALESMEQRVKRLDNEGHVNGVYFASRNGQHTLVIKPANEEMGTEEHPEALPVIENGRVLNFRGKTGSRFLRPGIETGLGPRNEHIAYLYAPDLVPMTLKVAFKSRPPFVRGASKTKICSVQRFINNGRAPRTLRMNFSSLYRMQKLAAMDIVLGQTDRHLDNLLIVGQGDVWAIDQGMTLPDLPHTLRLDWIYFPQMAEAVDPKLKQEILKKSPEKIRQFLERKGVNKKAARLAAYRLLFLQQALKKGLSFQEIGILLQTAQNMKGEKECEFEKMYQRAQGHTKRFQKEINQVLGQIQVWKKYVDKHAEGGHKLDLRLIENYPAIYMIILNYAKKVNRA